MLLCSNCSAPISSGDTSCVVCGAAQTSPLEIIMPPAPSVPATIPRDERPKRRPSRATMTIVGISVVALVGAGALATLLIGTRGTLVTTRGQLSAASGRLSDLRTRYDDLQGLSSSSRRHGTTAGPNWTMYVLPRGTRGNRSMPVRDCSASA
jgi:hypothetical protein